ncbi:hypothetical protein AB2B38_005620 [Balneola sp. MJW-20]|uniref:hypothetical protein n=1 Tax=Gracilimonas aurantiaca TaxID=3234185 RepID=UPI0034660ABC
MQQPKNIADRFSLGQITLAALLFMMSGVVIELFLLGHYEDSKQLIPVFSIGVSLPAAVILYFRRTTSTIVFFKIILSILTITGIYGTFLHLKANYEFETEMKPTSGGWDLIVDSLSGALPALAPGSMIALALIGFIFLKIIVDQQ